MVKIFRLFKKRNAMLFCIAILFSLIECISSSFQPFLLSEITRHFNNIANPVDLGIDTQSELNQVFTLFGVIVLMVGIGFLCRITARFFHIKSAIDIVERLRNNLF